MAWSNEELLRSACEFFSKTLGAPITPVPGSYDTSTSDFDATLRSELAAPGRIEFLVKLFSYEIDGAPRSVWALVFVYVAERRVAPADATYLVYRMLDDHSWSEGHWEADEFEEWSELDTIDSVPERPRAPAVPSSLPK
jgi:hypothetical protein